MDRLLSGAKSIIGILQPEAAVFDITNFNFDTLKLLNLLNYSKALSYNYFHFLFIYWMFLSLEASCSFSG